MKRKELAHKAQEKGNVKRHTALLAAVLSISVPCAPPALSGWAWTGTSGASGCSRWICG